MPVSLEHRQRLWRCSKCSGEFRYFAEHIPNYCPYCKGGPLRRTDDVTQLKARGVGRDAGDERFLSIAFNRRPTDDEMRAVHNFLQRPPGDCPFCKTTSYALPCTQCGEPDLPEAF